MNLRQSVKNLAHSLALSLARIILYAATLPNYSIVLCKVMQISDFQYDLPQELIANYPAHKRSDSRLLCLDASTGKLLHRRFGQLLDFLEPEDLLVFNNTRVIPARLFAQKESGGRVEILIERMLDTNKVMAQLRASKSPKPGTRLSIQRWRRTDPKGRSRRQRE